AAIAGAEALAEEPGMANAPVL
ncbi:hypothetical protein PAT3040_05746, partial [Paenibacillus agaridevorans]